MPMERNEPLLGSDNLVQPILSSESALLSIFHFIRDRKWSFMFLVLTWCSIIFGSQFDVEGFTWQSWWALGLTGSALFCLINDQPPDLVLLTVTILLRLSGVVTDAEAFSGFHSDGIIAIGALFIVAKSLENSGVIEWFMAFFLTRTDSTGECPCSIVVISMDSFP